MLCKPWLRSSGRRNRLNIVCRGRRLMSQYRYLILSSGSERKMQVVTTVEKPPLLCPFKTKEWLEEERTRVISKKQEQGPFCIVVKLKTTRNVKT